jgi:hypothetical protein
MTPLWDVDVDGIEVDMEYGISTICMETTSCTKDSEEIIGQ